jgi:hypothetical protein
MRRGFTRNCHADFRRFSVAQPYKRNPLHAAGVDALAHHAFIALTAALRLARP